MRDAVLIAYFFPPAGGVAVPRMLRPAQYLPRFGWRATVIAPASSGYPIQDPGGLLDIPEGLKVIRTPCPEPDKLRHLVDRRRGGAERHGRVALPRLRRGSRGPDLAVGTARQVVALARELVLPDEQIGWLPFAALAAIDAVRTQNASAIVSTSTPVTAHFAALVASRVTGVPWVADFRDPWVGNTLLPARPRRVHDLQVRLERRLVASATALTFVTPSLTRLYERRYPRHAMRMSTITNGYDRAERLTEVPRNEGPFTLVYAGSMYRTVELGTFLSGLRAAVGADPGLRMRLRVRFVGWATSSCQAILREAAASQDLGEMVDYAGLLPRDAALSVVSIADAALVLLPHGPGTDINAPGKLYDYIGLNRQILAIVPEGDAASLLRGLDWGVVRPPTVAGVADGIRTVMSNPPERAVADPEGRYDWETLSGRFANVLDQATCRRSFPDHPESE